MVVFLDTYKKIKNFSFVQSEDFIIDDMRVENFSTPLFSFDRSVQSILFPTCDKMIIDKTKAIADKYFSELLDDDTFELEGEFLFCLDYWARLTVRLAETPEELRERYEENFEVHVTGFGEILAWYDIAENILKIFMDEFTEDTGKFNDSQESVAFAYLEGELGSLKQEQGLYQKAFDYHQNSYEIFLRLLGEKHPDTCQAMNVLANTLVYLGRYDETLALQEKILALSEEISGEDSTENISILSNLAVTLNDLGRYDEALKIQEQVLASRKENLDEDDEDTLIAMQNLAMTLSDLGRYDEALKLQEQVLTLRKKFLGKEHPDTLSAMNNLALTLRALERYDEALEMNKKVLTLRKKILSDEHPKTVAAMNNLALTLNCLERHEEALPLQEKVLAFRKETLGEDDEDTVDAMEDLAMTLDDLKRHDEALKFRRQVLTLRKKFSARKMKKQSAR